jgi:hypothetical protein
MMELRSNSSYSIELLRKLQRVNLLFSNIETCIHISNKIELHSTTKISERTCPLGETFQTIN